MNRKLFRETVIKQCQFLIEDMYELRMVDNRNFWYEKKTDEKGYRIRFFLTEYGDTFHVIGPKAEKRFNIVEQYIQPVLNDVKLDTLYTIHKQPDFKYVSAELVHNETEGNNFMIKEEQELLLFLKFVQSFYFQTAVPFFDEYKSVNDINQKLSSLERDDITSLINNTGSGDVFYRELTIKFLSNSPDFEEYYNYILKEFEPLKGNVTFDKIIDNFKKLKKTLESG